MKLKQVVVVGAVAALVLSFSTQALAAGWIYMMVKGQKQGVFRGEVRQKGREGTILCHRFQFADNAVRDPQSGLPTGQRMLQPITITKEWDSSSPQFLQALVTNELIPTIIFHVWVPREARGAGEEIMLEKITLTNAYIIGIRRSYNALGEPQNYQNALLEEITFGYQRIEITHTYGGITAADGR